MQLRQINKCKIAVIGLGYVGLPLAIEFAKEQKSVDSDNDNIYKVIGFDIDKKRIEKLKNGHEDNNEIIDEDMNWLKKIDLTFEKKKPF